MLLYCSLPNNSISDILDKKSYLNGTPATGDLNLKLQKNGFSEAPQTWQVPRMVLGANFGKKLFGHMTPLGPPNSYKRGVMTKNIIFCVF